MARHRIYDKNVKWKGAYCVWCPAVVVVALARSGFEGGDRR